MDFRSEFTRLINHTPLTSIIKGPLLHSITVNWRVHECCRIIQVRNISNFSSNLYKQMIKTWLAYLQFQPPQLNIPSSNIAFIPVQQSLGCYFFYIDGFVEVLGKQCFICKVNRLPPAFDICVIETAFTQLLFLVMSMHLLAVILHSDLFIHSADSQQVKSSPPALSWRSCHHHSNVGRHFCCIHAYPDTQKCIVAHQWGVRGVEGEERANTQHKDRFGDSLSKGLDQYMFTVRRISQWANDQPRISFYFLQYEHS